MGVQRSISSIFPLVRWHVKAGDSVDGVIRRALRLLVVLGLCGVAGYAVLRLLDRRGGGTNDLKQASTEPWPRLVTDPTEPAPPRDTLQVDPASPAADSRPWVESQDGACPASHPVKGNLSSGIFHLPGMIFYDRTNADRCYAGPTEAEADGLRAAKR